MKIFFFRVVYVPFFRGIFFRGYKKTRNVYEAPSSFHSAFLYIPYYQLFIFFLLKFLRVILFVLEVHVGGFRGSFRGNFQGSFQGSFQGENYLEKGTENYFDYSLP